MSTRKTAREIGAALAQAHTDLNLWSAIITLLEGGLLASSENINGAAERQVIAICKRQIRRHYDRYEKALAALSEPQP